MMILRTIGFGLILGVYLMLAGYVAAAQWFTSTPPHAYWMTLRTMAPPLAQSVDAGLLFAAGYAVVCLAVGLVASSLAYPPMERGIHTLIRLVLPRWICAHPAAVAASSGETARPGVA